MSTSRDNPSGLGGRKWLILVVAALAVATGFLARRFVVPGDAPAKPDRKEEVAKQLDFALDALDGGRVSAEDYRGRVLVVDFWATWCGPCRLQDEILHALHERYQSEPVSFIAINVGEPLDLVRDFVKDDPFAYPVLMDPAQSLSAKYGIYALPTVMVLGPEQQILFQNMGVSTGIQVRSAIDRALGG